ncbi:MAG: HU family DNA-binding protein [Alphaproteobacteria bacterium]|nr:HU family DNA-binding protein [Alphaproteobacteria bacterium]
MNKAELIRAISEKSDLTAKNAEKFLDSFVEIIIDTVKKGEEVNLIGFGSFFVTDREERTGRNFRTGSLIQIPASKAVRFKAGKGLRDCVTKR